MTANDPTDTRDSDLAPRGRAMLVLDSSGRGEVECVLRMNVIDPQGALLVWAAGLVDAATCVVDGTRALRVHRRGHLNTVRVPASDHELCVIIRYACLVPPAQVGHARVYGVGRRAFPHAPEWLQRTTASARLPQRDPPDFTLDVRVADGAMQAFGPQYYDSRSAQGDDVRRFAFYHGTFFGMVWVGPFVPAYDDGLPVFVVPTAGGDKFARDVEACARLGAQVRGLFQQRLGTPPTPLARVLLLGRGHEAASYCLGATVAVTAGPHDWDNRLRRDWLLSVLAHECAHAWMAYGTCWTHADVGRTVNELLAVTMQADAIQSIGSSESWEAFFRTDLWPKTISAGASPLWWLKTSGYYFGAMSSANLLVSLLRRRPHAVRAAIDRVWATSRDTVLSLEHLRTIVRDTVGEEAATGMDDALREPHPIVGRARVQYSPANRRWRLQFTATKLSEVAKLVKRLSVAVLPSPARLPKGIAYEASSPDVLFRRVFDIQPYHVVFERETRQFVLRHKPWKARLWAWVEEVGMQVQPRVAKVAIAGLLGILLNPEHPRGYVMLSAACRTRLPWFANRLRLLAASRAVYPDEAELMRDLSG